MNQLMSAPQPQLLALRTLKLGDLLVAVPALKGLRKQFPDHRIVLAAPAWLQPIVQLVDAIDELLPTPGLDERLSIAPGVVDVAVNMHGSGTESQSVVEALMPRLMVCHRSAWRPDAPVWLDGIHERQRWARLVNAFGASADPNDVSISVPGEAAVPHGTAVVHVGAHYGSRHWPVERFASVARALEGAGREVVITGGAGDVQRAQQVAQLAGLSARCVLAGRANLTEFAAVIAHAAVLVSVDTGAAHLASAYGVPSVVIFGPAPPEEWGPPPGPHTVLTDATKRLGHTFAQEPDPALLAVSASDASEAALALLHE